MASSRSCSQCGTRIDALALGGVCPVCSLQAALAAPGSLLRAEPENGAGSEAKAAAAAGGPSVPRRLGDYDLLEEIARGGMGVVYKARQTSLDRLVAVKMLLFGALARPEEVRRFRAEASVAASLQHPNVVAIHEVGVQQDQHYLVMDYVDGPTLADLVAGGPLSPRQAAGLMQTVAEAIHHAHEHGILHRDLKPSNVLVDQFGQPRVADFGLAKRLSDTRVLSFDPQLTLTGQLIGSPNYMAPEQAVAKRGLLGPRADVYGLGAILYHLITGRPPFTGQTPAEVLHQVLQAEPVAPRLLNATIPRDLETVCLKCLEKQPHRRYTTARELAQELGRVLRGEPIEARRLTALGRGWRWCTRHPAVAVLSLATLLLLITVLIGLPVAIVRVQSARSSLEQHLYAADMELTLQAWENGDWQGARERLESHRPRQRQADLRGFEWAYLWRLCQDESRHSFHFPGRVTSISMAGDGRLLAAASGPSIELLDVVEEREVGELGTGQTVDVVAFSPRWADLLAGAGRTLSGIGLWDVSLRKKTAELPCAEGILALAFSPDGSLLAGGGKSSVSVWEMDSQRCLWTTNTSDSVTALAFSPDGQTLVSAEVWNGDIAVWRARTGATLSPLLSHHKGWVNAAAFAPDGRTLATAANDGFISLWKFDSRTLERAFAEPQGQVEALAFSGNGTYLLGTSHAVIRVWDCGTGQPLGLVKRGHKDKVVSLAFGKRDRFYSASLDGSVKIWDLPAPASSNIIAGVHADWVGRPNFSPDGKRLVSGDLHPPFNVVICDVETRTVTHRLSGHANPVCNASFSPDGKILASGSEDRTIRLWDAESFEFLGPPLTNEFGIGTVSFSPDGAVIAAAAPIAAAPEVGYGLAFWDVRSRRKVQLLREDPGPVRAVAFSKHGGYLASGWESGRVDLWDFTTGARLHSFTNPLRWKTALAFSDDGRWLLCSGPKHSVDIYDVQTGRLIREVPLRTASAWQVGLAPGNRSLVSVADDGLVRFASAETGELVLTLKGHHGPVCWFEFSPDHLNLATCGADGDVRLWPAAELMSAR